MKNFLTKLRGWLFSGILVVAPLMITFYIIWLLMDTMDGLVKSLVPTKTDMFARFFAIPGFGFVLAMLVLIIIGALAKGVAGSFFIRKGEQVVHKLPFIRSLYAGVKQVFEAFFGSNSPSFRQVGMIEYPRRGVWSLCFVTGATVGEVQDKTSHDVVNVFVPTTPNPTSGFLLFLPKEDVLILDMKVDEGLKMVISAGIVTPMPKAATEALLKKEQATENKRTDK